MAVNHLVLGSNPSAGAIFFAQIPFFPANSSFIRQCCVVSCFRTLRSSAALFLYLQVSSHSFSKAKSALSDSSKMPRESKFSSDPIRAEQRNNGANGTQCSNALDVFGI